MSSSSTVRCDQCGRTEADDAARDGRWHYLMPREPISWFYGDRTGERRPRPDLCSWECVRDYATAQILDPAPGHLT